MPAQQFHYRLPSNPVQRQLALRIEQMLFNHPQLMHLSILPPPVATIDDPVATAEIPPQLDLQNPDREAAIRQLLEERFRLNMGVLQELEIVRAAMLLKPDLYWTWFNQFAACAIQEGVEETVAARTAQRILQTMFGLISVATASARPA